jgi:hypothetical protein
LVSTYGPSVKTGSPSFAVTLHSAVEASIPPVAEDEDAGDLHLLDHGSDGGGLLAHLLQREVGHPLVVECDQIFRHCRFLSGRTRASWWLLCCSGHDGRRTPTPRTAAL